MSPLRNGALAVLAAWGVGCKPAVEAPAPGPLQVGVATVALDVPVGQSMGGYSRHLGTSEQGSPYAAKFPASVCVHSTPTARALALTDGLTRVVLVRVDECLTVSSLRFHAEAILRDRGLDARLVVFSTHTHAGPSRFFRPILGDGSSGFDAAAQAMDSFDPEAEERLATSIADAAQGALGSVKPASVGAASVDASDFNHDRRCENDDLYGPDYRDRQMTVVRFDEVDADGKPVRPLAGLLHYAMHGTTLGSDNLLFSTDSPGAMELYASDAVGVPLLYVQGTAGDVSPASGPLGHSGFQAIERIGRLASVRAADAFQRAAPPPRPAQAKLQLYEPAIDLSHARLGYAQGEFLAYGGVGCMLGAENCPPVPNLPKDVICLPLGRRGFNQATVVALRLEGVLFAALPGEPSTAIGARVREAVGAVDGVSTLLTVGYAQDHFGYILEADDWLRGGYEPTVSPWGWKFGPFMVARMGEAVAALGKPTPELAKPEALLAPRRTPTDSAAVPAVESSPADLDRLATAVLRFHGGDPGLGTPEVALEHEEGGSFVPVMASPTRRLVNGPEVVLRYQAMPTQVADPGAASRDHLWTAEWETVPDSPLGRYRLVATGKAQRGGTAAPYTLTGGTFTLAPARTCGALASAAVDASGLLKVEVRFPPNPSVSGVGGQVANYRLRDAQSSPNAGALATGGTGSADVTLPDASHQMVSLHYDAGARAHLAQVSTQSGTYSIHLAPGAFADGSGNVNGAAVDVQATR